MSYLVFHGSHDGDVTSFGGLRQYQRVACLHEVGGAQADLALQLGVDFEQLLAQAIGAVLADLPKIVEK